MCNSQWYDAFYLAVERSKAYSSYCEQAFGRDFSQQGFCDMRQISFMLDKVQLQPGQSVLDIGCGNGKLLEYIADAYCAVGHGIDISAAAIVAAKRRTAGKAESLFFQEGSINSMQYTKQSFDAVISIDTLYFADDLRKTLREILSFIKPGGCFAAFFSEFRFSQSDPLDKLTMDGTGLAAALREEQIAYDAYDFAKSHYEIMRRKRIVLTSLKPAFEQEKTEILYENAFTESIDEGVSFGDFQKFSSRYLYMIKK